MYKDIPLDIDLTDASSWKKALSTAVGPCQAFGAILNMLSVVPDFGMTVVGQYFPKDIENQAVGSALKELHALSERHVPTGVEVKHVIAYGDIYEETLAAARTIKCNLILIAAQWPELKNYLSGPNAARVVRHADRSVLRGARLGGAV